MATRTTTGRAIVGGLLALAAFGIMWFSAGERRFAGDASQAGTFSFATPDGTLFIFTGQDTTDIHFVKEQPGRRFEKFVLDMQEIQ